MSTGERSSNLISKMHIDSSDGKVRNFGFLFCVVFALLAGFSWYKGGHVWPWLAGGSALFLLLGLVAKPILRPIYIGWMAFAFVLGWINTRLILGVFFYAILLPVGVIFKILRKDPLERTLDRQAPSYWIKREPVPIDRERCARPF